MKHKIDERLEITGAKGHAVELDFDDHIKMLSILGQNEKIRLAVNYFVTIDRRRIKAFSRREFRRWRKVG